MVEDRSATDTPTPGAAPPPPAASSARARVLDVTVGVLGIAAAIVAALWGAPQVAVWLKGLPSEIGLALGGGVLGALAAMPAAAYLGARRHAAAAAGYAARADALAREVKSLGGELRAQDAVRANEPGLALLTQLGGEMRAPVRSAVAALDRVSPAELPPGRAAAIETVQAASRMFLTMLDGVLAAGARDVAGAGRARRRTALDPAGLVDDVAHIFGPAAAARHVEVVCAPSVDLPRRILASEPILVQAVAALVGDAIHAAAPGGHIDIAARWEPLRGDAGRFIIETRSAQPPGTKPEAAPENAPENAPDDAHCDGEHVGGLRVAHTLANRLGGAVQRVPARAGVDVVRLSIDVDARRGVATHDFPGVAVLVAAPPGRRRANLLDRLARLGVAAYAVDRVDGVLAAASAAARQPDLVVACGRDGAALKRLAASFAGASAPPRLAALLRLGADILDRSVERTLLRVLAEPVRQSDLIALLADAQAAGLEAVDPETGPELKALLVATAPPDVEHAIGVLEALRCDVTVCQDREAALDAAASGRFDLCIVDDDDLDAAIALAEDLRRTASADARPVVCLVADPACKPDLRPAGVDAVLAKPLALGAVRQAIAGRDAMASGVVDASKVVELRRARLEGEETVGRLIRLFLESAPGLAEKVHDAVANGDIDAASRHADALGAASRDVGGMELSAMMADVESLARAGDVGGMRAAAKEIHRALGDLNMALQTLEARG